MENIYKMGIKWLNTEFGNLTKVIKGDKTFYVDDERKPLFYYYQDEKNGDIYINYERIWSFFEDVFVFDYEQIQGVLNSWLEETYNLRGHIPTFSTHLLHLKLEESYNLKRKQYGKYL
jgi:hypothetical protein